MRPWWVPFLAISFAISCSRGSDEGRRFELHGQILAVRPERNEVVIKHEDVKGLMPGMTMPFTVKDPALLQGKQPGDLVTATLIVGEVQAHLSTLTTTGHAAPAAPAPPPPPDIRQPGDMLTDAPLVDQDGASKTLSSYRGHRVAITFIYTRCPLPDFCPLMDKHFATIQKTIASTPSLADVRLVTATLDPAFDTPKIMRAHANRVGADLSRWTFLTGDPKTVSQFETQFGVYVEEDSSGSSNIIHNLRTAVIDPQGRLVKIHTGNDWTPSDLIADLEATPAPAH
jgi:protein SCO1